MDSGSRNITPYMSAKIGHLMFILSILVVYIHMNDFQYASVAGYEVEQFVEYALSQCMFKVAVPLFFAFSGYLTFSKQGLTSWQLVLYLKKKARSLGVPYLFWNTFYLLVFVGAKVATGTLHEVVNWPSTVLKSIFLYGSNYALWYVFQLILLSVLSPLLLKLYENKYMAIGSVVVFGVMYLFIKSSPLWLPLPGLFFYSIGAVVAKHGCRAVDCSVWTVKKRRIISIAAIIACIVLLVYRLTLDGLSDIDGIRTTPQCRAFEALLAVAFWYAVDIFPLGDRKVYAFEKHSFLIYVGHIFGITVLNIVFERLPFMTPWLRAGIYALAPLVIVAVITACAMFAKRFLPRFYSLISGGRG